MSEKYIDWRESVNVSVKSFVFKETGRTFRDAKKEMRRSKLDGRVLYSIHHHTHS